MKRDLKKRIFKKALIVYGISLLTLFVEDKYIDRKKDKKLKEKDYKFRDKKIRTLRELEAAILFFCPIINTLAAASGLFVNDAIIEEVIDENIKKWKENGRLEKLGADESQEKSKNSTSRKLKK